ncbi:MAG: SOS response-associated peptidase [Candidatus Limnocylindrales bacterium]
MCGRFTQQRPTAELAAMFDAEPPPDELLPTYNLAPTDPAAVVVERADRRAIRAYRWGLIPSWAKDEKVASRMFNARAETLAASGAFRESFRRRRCIVPADAFYEWQRLGGARQPFLIRRTDGAPLALAGLWSGWHHPETEQVIRSFTIVTTTANRLVSSIHHRMPVVLAAQHWDLWLDPANQETEELGGLLQPSADDELVLFPVRPLVNNVRNNGPELIEPA